LLGLALGYIEPRHRLNLLSDDIRDHVVAARTRIIERLAAELPNAVAVYEPEHYNAGSSIEANILFGRVTHGIADAAIRVRQAGRETLQELGLRDIVIAAGLGFIAGPGGKRLTQAQRQKVSLARALLKNPDLLIVNRGLGSLSPRAQRAIMLAVAEYARPQGTRSRFAVFWVLAAPTLVDIFDRVVVFHDGNITADGAPDKLLASDRHLQRLVA
jgi:putative ABC transport system ATP-binding protein